MEIDDWIEKTLKRVHTGPEHRENFIIATGQGDEIQQVDEEGWAISINSPVDQMGGP